KYLHNIPNKVGYITFVVISYSLYLDWVHIGDEFRADNDIKRAVCDKEYTLNRCDTPIHAMVGQCIKWYTCIQKQSVPGTEIWSEIINRFINKILALEPHAIIIVTIIVFILLVLSIDVNIMEHILDIVKDITCFFLICL